MIDQIITGEAREQVIRRRVLLNTISNNAGVAIRLGIGFLLTPFILHHIGPSDFGLLALVVSVVGYGSLLEFGIAGAITKYVAEYRARGETFQAQYLIATAVALYSVFGLIVIGISLSTAQIFPKLFSLPPDIRLTATWLIYLLGLQIAISIPSATTSAILHGLQRYDLVNLTSTIETLISAASTVLVLLSGGGVIGMVVVSIPPILITQAARILIIHRIAPELRFGWIGVRRHLIRTILSFSTSLFVTNVAWRLETKTDQLVIGAFLPINAVTPYSVAQRLSEVPQIVSEQFVKVLLPLASELHAENDQVRLRSAYITGTRMMLAIFLPVGCTLIILARPLLTVWVGAAYADYAHLVTILSLASLFGTSQWPAGSILQGMGRHRPLALISVGTGLANVALSILLVQSLGLTGVALGTLIPTSIACIGFVLPYAMRVIGVSAREMLNEILLPAFLPAIPMAVIVYASQQMLEPSSLLSIVAVAGTGAFVYLMGYLSARVCKAERETCRSIAVNTIRLAGVYLKSM